MTELTMTLGQHWVNHYLYGIMLLHHLMGYEIAITPEANPTPETFVMVLQDVVSGSYNPHKYFKTDKKIAHPEIAVPAPPPLEPGRQYLLIRLNASTTLGQTVSVPSGGILYEEPVWAILAAHAISKGLLVALPMVKDNEDLWNKTSLLAEAVKKGDYDPKDFFGAITGFLPSGSSPKFQMIEVGADKVISLRDRGIQSIYANGSLLFFEMFQPPRPE